MRAFIALVLLFVAIEGAAGLQVKPTYVATAIVNPDGSISTGIIIPTEAWTADDLNSFAGSPTVMEHLELTAEQRDSLLSAIKESNDAYAEAIQQTMSRQMNPLDSTQLMTDYRAENLDRLENAFDSVLLPHQRHRLQQLRTRSRFENGAFDLEAGLARLGVELTAEQKKMLNTKGAELREELIAEIQDLRRKKLQELLDDVLTAEQQEKVNDLMGAPLKRIPTGKRD